MKNLRSATTVFSGKVVVVTGSGSGIGRATAQAFARAGARVHLVDRDAARAQQVAEEITQEGGLAWPHAVDCSDPAAMGALAAALYASEGRVDVLHNNAGVGHGAPIEQTSLEDWDWVLTANLRTVINGVWAFVPRMIAQGGGGHIVNTASAAGLFGLPGMAPYCASKFAVVGLSESLGAELSRHGIGVTAICPGLVQTRIITDGRVAMLGDGGKEEAQRLYGKLGVSAERIAQDVLKAVRKKKPLMATPWHVFPVWWLKRASPALYAKVTRLLAPRLLGRKRPQV